jgi:hypothetical protein
MHKPEFNEQEKGERDRDAIAAVASVFVKGSRCNALRLPIWVSRFRFVVAVRMTLWE